MIPGIVIGPLKRVVDERGYLMEMNDPKTPYNCDIVMK